MADSREKLLRSGAITAKAAARIGRSGTWKTTGKKGGVPSKMAAFESKGTMGDEHKPPAGPAGYKKGHINGPNQGYGPKMSKGGRVNKGGQPTDDHIDEDQNPKFPAGGNVGKRGKWGTGKNQRSTSNPPTNPDQYSGRSARP